LQDFEKICAGESILSSGAMLDQSTGTALGLNVGGRQVSKSAGPEYPQEQEPSLAHTQIYPEPARIFRATNDFFNSYSVGQMKWWTGKLRRRSQSQNSSFPDVESALMM
jgi:hypothetical protein